jgi:hypothetical protein
VLIRGAVELGNADGSADQSAADQNFGPLCFARDARLP